MSVLSKDGTRIGYTVTGNGPPLLLVDGALCSRTFGPMAALVPLLTAHFSVVTYDRRGRGESGDTAPYAVEREIEDLLAIAAAVGSPLGVYGTSSGAVLAARAVAAGLPTRKLVLHEPPLALDGVHHPKPADFREQIAAFLAAGRRGDAVKMFMGVVGVPALVIVIMRLMPGPWPKLKAVAHTLPYDFAILGDTQSGGVMPAEFASVLSSIDVPTLLLVGGKSPPWMHHAATRIGEAIANAMIRVLPGQNHNVAAKALAPALIEHFS